MKHEAYVVNEVASDFATFNFISIGKKGTVFKRIIFEPTIKENIVNMVLGDVDEDDHVDDRAISDNGDRDKVLATVVRVINEYTRRFPEKAIEIEGSTVSRTRLYRMAIGLYLEELSILYEIFAYNDGDLGPFQKDMDVEYFLIKRKKV